MSEIVLSPAQSHDVEVASGDVVIRHSDGNVLGILRLAAFHTNQEPLRLTSEQIQALWERSKIPVEDCLTTEQAIQRLSQLMSE